MGQFEYEVMSAIQRLGSQAYGAAIWEDIESRTGRSISIGGLYTALGRLERKGFVYSRTGEPTAERGGRAKKYYTIRAPGLAAMNAHEDRLARGGFIPRPAVI